MGATSGDDGGLRPVPRVGPVFLLTALHVVIFLRTADPGGLHAHGGCEIRRSQRHGLQTRRRRGDLFHMGDTGSGFNDDFKADLLLSPLGGLDRGHQRIDRIDIRRTAHFRDHDLVEPRPGLLQQVHHVTIPIGRVQPVDPHRKCLLAPVDLGNRLDDIGAGAVFVRGGHAVFEVEVDHIGIRSCHLFKDRRAGAGAEQLAAVRASRGGRLNAEAHGAPIGNKVSSRVFILV